MVLEYWIGRMVIYNSEFGEDGEVFIMIKKIDKEDIVECVKVIRESFATVADEFGFRVAFVCRTSAYVCIL